MLEFIKNNWSNIALIIVTATALVVYVLQERKKITEAAALIRIQIDELQKGISEIDSYIVNGQLNSTSFYESQLLYNENYWEKYKHCFVKKIDSKDFASISKLYEYASEIQEQQLLMKNLQKNFFYLNQQALSNLETSEAIKNFTFQSNAQLINECIDAISKKITAESDEKSAEKIYVLIEEYKKENAEKINQNNLTSNKQQIASLFNQQYFTQYCPLQIRLSLEKYIKKYTMLEIDGTDGYKKIKKLSERKF